MERNLFYAAAGQLDMCKCVSACVEQQQQRRRRRQQQLSSLFLIDLRNVQRCQISSPTFYLSWHHHHHERIFFISETGKGFFWYQTDPTKKQCVHLGLRIIHGRCWIDGCSWEAKTEGLSNPFLFLLFFSHWDVPYSIEISWFMCLSCPFWPWTNGLTTVKHSRGRGRKKK